MGTRVERAVAQRLRLPLPTPYRWRGGVVESFDSTFTVITDDTGATGVGEGTAVPGYSHETPQQVWETVQAVLPDLPGRPVDDLLVETQTHTTRTPFALASVRGALEHLVGSLRLPTDLEPIPLVGTVRASTQAEGPAARELAAAGYRTLKLKVGQDPVGDLRRVRALQRHVPGVALRLDANQGYSFDEAVTFVSGLDPAGIELVEQPLPADAWADQHRLRQHSAVPLMLDEAIWDDDDLRRAAECADLIKLKVMKAGGADRTSAQIARAVDLGLGVVLGNGVATEVDAYAEAVVHARAGLTTAAELNGFTKLSRSPVREPFAVRNGCLDIAACSLPHLDDDSLTQFGVDRMVVT